MIELKDIKTYLDNFADKAIDIVPSLLLALLVMVLFYIVARVARSKVKILVVKVSENRAIGGLMGTLSYIGLIVLGAIIALRILQLDSAATSILASAGVLGLALGFAFQDIMANFIAGVVLAITRPFKIGDLIETNEQFGLVERISLRSTEIKALEGQHVQIPNKDIFLSPLKNYNAQALRRVDIACGVAYDTDLKQAKDTAIEAVRSLDISDERKPIELFYNEFGGSSINFTLRFWISFSKQPDFLEAQSLAIMAITEAYAQNNIDIPFPITVVKMQKDS